MTVYTKSEKVEFVEKLKKRTKQVGLDAIQLYKTLPKSEEARIVGKQFLRSSLFVGANYRAVCRARSKAEYFAKLSITVEEADETLYWIDVMQESGIIKNISKEYRQELLEIVSILAKTRKNTHK